MKIFVKAEIVGVGAINEVVDNIWLLTSSGCMSQAARMGYSYRGHSGFPTVSSPP